MSRWSFAALGAAACIALSLAAGSAQAQMEPYGPGFAGWTFGQYEVSPGVYACRGTRKTGGISVLLQTASNGTNWIALSKPGNVNGKFPKSYFNLVSGHVPVAAATAGNWLWFGSIDEWTMERIVTEGGFVWVIKGANASNEVDLGGKALEALDTINSCIQNY